MHTVKLSPRVQPPSQRRIEAAREAQARETLRRFEEAQRAKAERSAARAQAAIEREARKVQREQAAADRIAQGWVPLARAVFRVSEHNTKAAGVPMQTLDGVRYVRAAELEALVAERAKWMSSTDVAVEIGLSRNESASAAAFFDRMNVPVTLSAHGRRHYKHEDVQAVVTLLATLLTVEQTAVILRRTADEVQRFARCGSLPSIKGPRKQPLFKRADVDAFAERTAGLLTVHEVADLLGHANAMEVTAAIPDGDLLATLDENNLTWVKRRDADAFARGRSTTVTFNEAAKLLSVNPSIVEELVKARVLVFTLSPSGRLLFRRDDVMALVLVRTKGSSGCA